MHIKGFLHKLLSSVMHKKRLVTLTLLIETVLHTKKLSLSDLGRGMKLPIQERSGIRRADRFLSNFKFHTEKSEINKIFVEKIIGNRKQVDILVDWTGVPNTKDYVLRAAVAAEGRAITLYEEVHPGKKLGNAVIQRNFLLALHALVPKSCKPIIITDGGFHNEWFAEVRNLNWDYLGRIRALSGKLFCQAEDGDWKKVSELCSTATGTPKHVGEVKLCKANSLKTNLYLYLGKKKGRMLKTKRGKKRIGGNTEKYTRSSTEPWILATSLDGKSYLVAKRVIKKYKLRMQIEEGIRDLKSTGYGFSFRNSYTKDRKRIEVLLFIAMLAAFIAWLVGWVGEKKNLHYQFQSSSNKTRRVLSLFFLGCQMIQRKVKITLKMLDSAIHEGLLCEN